MVKGRVDDSRRKYLPNDRDIKIKIGLKHR